MKICHVCMAECEENEEFCPVCGALLNDEDNEEVIAEKEKESENEIIKNPILLATFDDVVNAEIFKDILTENGIRYSGNAAPDESSLKVVFGVGLVADDIFVDESDFDEADKLYNEFLENPPEFEEVFDDSFEPEEEI